MFLPDAAYAGRGGYENTARQLSCLGRQCCSLGVMFRLKGYLSSDHSFGYPTYLGNGHQPAMAHIEDDDISTRASTNSPSPSRDEDAAGAPRATPALRSPAAAGLTTPFLSIVTDSAFCASRGGRITKALATAVSDQKEIQKKAKKNAAVLKNVRQQKYRLLQRIEGCDEDNMDAMKELFDEMQRKRAAKKQAALGGVASCSSSPPPQETKK